MVLLSKVKSLVLSLCEKLARLYSVRWPSKRRNSVGIWLLWFLPQAIGVKQSVMSSFIQTNLEKPRAWFPKELRQDFSWIHHLSREAVIEIEQALQHAKATQKSWLQMTANDFPLQRHAKQAIDQAFAVLQTPFCMLIQVPLLIWSWSI